MNIGNGGFGPLVSYTTPEMTTGTRYLALTDVNGEGHLDLVFPGLYTNPGQFIASLGRADGTFATAAAFTPTGVRSFRIVGSAELHGDGTFTPGNPISLSRAADFLSAADLDGDGHADLVLSGVGDPIVRYGSADRSFGPERVLAAGFQPGKVALADLRGIGKTDLILPNSTQTA